MTNQDAAHFRYFQIIYLKIEAMKENGIKKNVKRPKAPGTVLSEDPIFRASDSRD